MNVFVKNAKYIGDFKFQIVFNVGASVVDVKKIYELDKRYDFLTKEDIVSKMEKDGPSIGYKSYDIAPELLYQVAS